MNMPQQPLASVLPFWKASGPEFSVLSLTYVILALDALSRRRQHKHI